MIRPGDDPLLPGVQIALNLDRFVPLLNGELREHGEALEATGGTIVDVQYKPGRTCLVMYRLRLRDRRTGRSMRRLFSAQVSRRGEEPSPLPPALLERFAAYRKKPLATPELHLPGAGVIVRPFPLDTAMPWLVDAVNSSAMRRHLNPIWRTRHLRVRRVTHRVLGYTPQARAALVYEIQAEHRQTGRPEVRRVVGKTHFYKAPDRLFANAWALWRAAQGRVGLAEPLGYIAPLRMTLQEQVRGQRLTEFAGSERFAPLVRRTARAIATVHSLSFPLTTQRNTEHEMRVVHRWADVLLVICPQLGSQVEHLRDRLVARLAEHSVQAGPVHGDFHPANVLSDGHDVTFIDLDEMAYGDPLVDVGRFLASLRVSAMRVYGDPAGLADAEETFLDEYLAHAPGTGVELRARLFEATSLLIAAATPFRLQRAGWEQGAAQLLDEAERVLSGAHATSRAHRMGDAPEPATPPEQPLAQRLEWAGDGKYVQALLHPHVLEISGVNLTSCKADVARASESGYRIPYRLSGRRENEKWRASFVGFLSRERRGGGLGRRLTALRTALAGNPDAPSLPRPVAHLRELSMLVVEAFAGTPLPDLLGTSEAPQAGAALGRALAALQRADAGIQKTYAADDELRSLDRQVTKLGEVRPDLGDRAAAAFREIAERYRAVPERQAPTLRALPPEHILWLGDRIAVGEVRDVALSHPLIDIADLLARLALIGVKRHSGAAAAELAEQILGAYAAAGGADLGDLAAFASGAHLRLASHEAEQTPHSAAAEHLLRHAEARLALA